MTERIFLLRHLPPEAARWKATDIQLGWMEAGSREICLKDQGERRTMTVSLTGTAGAASREIRLDKESLDILWRETLGRRLQFTRRQGRIGRHSVAIDQFAGSLSGLETVRVFSAEALPQRRHLPWDWLGVEVGYDARFAWRALAACAVQPELGASLNDGSFAGEIGAIPYLRSSDGLRLMLCTTQRRDRWIFPKGQCKPGLAWRDVALMEAAEEAGLIGEVTGAPILCSHLKGTGPVDLLLFPMEVKSTLKVWQESETRDRAQFTLEELLARPDMENLLPGLRMIEHLSNGWKTQPPHQGT